MTTPRTTRLIRTPDLQAFQRAIRDILPDDVFAARECAVIVATHSGAEELRRTIENARLGEARSAAVPLPHVVTRDEFYRRLHERLPHAPPLLTPFDREVLLRRASHQAREGGAEPPFNVRPGLIVEMLRLYDDLRRAHRSVDDFERLMVGTLEPSVDHDRGAARLLAETIFLVAAFRLFEASVAATGSLDEHGLRAQVIGASSSLYRHVIVTVGDQDADRHGLWSADFDLLARMPGLDRLDVVTTDALLDAGFHQRLHERLLPGIEEERTAAPAAAPVLLVPEAPPGADAPRLFVCRDREEELAEFARALKTAGDTAPLDRTAIVFQRPLPYLYLARQVFEDARVPYQALDSLPLASEPFAAMIDLLFAAIAADFTRAALIDLLRSPHLRFGLDGRAITTAEVTALDRFLVERKYLGGADRLSGLVTLWEIERAGTTAGETIGFGLRIVSSVAHGLASALAAPTAQDQIDGLIGFIAAHEVLPAPSAPWYSRHMRARSAVLAALRMLSDAHAAHDSRPLTVSELSGTVRRWIEGQTFSPRSGTVGLGLLEAAAAVYADVDEIRIVGLNETDWPERSTRNIFYPQSLLTQLGWPSEQQRLLGARARFHDLLRLPRRRVSLSSFTLEDDALVSASPLLEDVETLGLRAEREASPKAARVFTREALMLEPFVASAIEGAAAGWLSLRMTRPVDERRFHGSAGARQPGVYAVSRVEQYLACPFRYFAGDVLRLPEERDSDAWLTPQERGQFVHQVFCEFFTEWQQYGNGAITPANVSAASELFTRVAERHLERLPEGDRALERTFLLGSAAAPGLAERAFAFEIEQALPIRERLLEYDLQDAFTFAAPDGPRQVRIRAKADRIDLIEDGTLRIVDYKLTRAPRKDRSLQLAVYGICAEQALEGRHGRAWRVSSAGYVAFKEKKPFVGLGDGAQELREAMTSGQEKLIAAIDGIEAGEFPPQPDEPFLCTWCAYPSVCRKDYVGDE